MTNNTSVFGGPNKCQHNFMLRNTDSRYGRVAILLHWAIALIVFTQFGVGLYMVDLDYYHPLYHTLPHYHKSTGIVLAALVVFRLLWAAREITPAPGTGVGIWEQRVSYVVKNAMTAVLVAIVVFGYLLSTAEGDPVEVFNWFEIPALMQGKGQEDISLFWHYWLAWTIISLAVLHTLGALKHHFIDRDETLRRMLGLSSKPNRK